MILLKPKPVIFLLLIPILKMYHKVYVRGVHYALYAIEHLYIYNSYSAKLYKMPRNVRRGTYKRVLAHFPYLHHIIRHKPVSALNKLQGVLALSYSALTRDKKPLAIHIKQHAMNGNAGRKHDIEPADYLCHK